VRIYHIQRFSLNDGPGIRTTVFLKGCPLSCAWCHNPESQSEMPELLHYDPLCIRCGACAAVCPTRCLTVRPDGWTIDRARCDLCGRCVEACPTDALVLRGRDIGEEELVARILDDRAFFDESGGGVTFSGGEPLLQAAELANVLPRLRAKGIHVAVETAGCVDPVSLDRVTPHVDLFLYDVKSMDPDVHQRATGSDNALVLANLARLAASGKDVVVRTPVIPGFNDTPEALGAIASHVVDLGLRRIDLLPFHPLATAKYQALGRQDAMAGIPAPDPDRMESLRRAIGHPGLVVRIEGAPEPSGGWDEPKEG
jgi:pyruvate formate lyase activating enzyme